MADGRVDDDLKNLLKQQKACIKVDAIATAIYSHLKTMKTCTTTTTSLSWWLFLVLVLGVLCQDIAAGVVQTKQGKPKNSTVTTKEVLSSTSTPKPHKHASKVKATTTTTSTTPKPKKDATTVKPSELDLDGRHAFINNHFVEAQEEPIQDAPQPLYDLIQKQMESVLSNTGLGSALYADSPQVKEMLTGNQNSPDKPLFSYNMNQFGDYEEDSDNENEDELLEQEEQQPDNCEDTEESLSENEQNSYGQTKPPMQQQNSGYTLNKPSHSSGGRPGKGGSYDSTNYNPTSSSSQDNGYGPTGHYHHHNQKPAEQPSNTGYGTQTPNDNQQSYKPSHTHDKPKPSHTSKPSQSTSNQHKPQKPSKSSNGKPVHSTKSSNQATSNGGSNSISSSPFSTTTTNNINKYTSNKRHLTFRTVSSSTQYVSTPMADLMLKFSIGMAKPAKSQEGRRESQIYDKNDIELSV